MRFVLVILIFLLALQLSAQKVYRAERITDPIKIDGILEEQSWEGDYAGEFIQYEPNVGDLPSERSEVRIRYDDDAIYVGAKLFDSNPTKILKELANRDESSNTDVFTIGFDTYKDGINSFVFSITAAGVQKDGKFSSQGEDISWDGVWESAVSQDEFGWHVEMKIPYYTIRFANKQKQIWGLQIIREVRRLREQSYWNAADPNKDGFVNQFGILEGIENIKPPFRLSVTPYVSGYYNSSFIPGDGSSYEDGTAYSAGMDVKLGLSDAFTLDMTLVPDFGQTISDDQVLNLSPFELYFQENRPFFTEGLELFNKGGLFYTRRVGGVPLNYNRVDDQLEEGERILKNPFTTSLINASKLSGRTSGGLGIGVFNGITAEENAIIEGINGQRRRYTTSPLTNYNVLVFDQTFKNNSFVSLVNTNTLRFGHEYDANVTGFQSAFNDKDQKFGFRLSGATSNQYDASGNNFGYTYNAEVGKYSGLWTYSFGHGLESDRYNPNDLGFLFSPNEIYNFANIRYNQYAPKNDKLNLYRYSGGINYATLYKPLAYTEFNVYFSNFWLYKSRNAFGYDINFQPESHNYFEPRTADFSNFLPIPASIGGGGFFSSDYRKVFALDFSIYTTQFVNTERNQYDFELSPRIRFSDKFSLFFTSALSLYHNDQGYVSRTNGDGEDVLVDPESVVLMGTRDRQVVVNSVQLKYIFTNKMGLNLRIRHYWDRVDYNQFDGLYDGSLNDVTFNDVLQDEMDYFDTNFNQFNIDMQYQWRFAPGSDLFVVWKNNIRNSNQDLDVNYLSNLGNLFDQFQNNSLSLRAVYFLDYNKFI